MQVTVTCFKALFYNAACKVTVTLGQI